MILHWCSHSIYVQKHNSDSFMSWRIAIPKEEWKVWHCRVSWWSHSCICFQHRGYFIGRVTKEEIYILYCPVLSRLILSKLVNNYRIFLYKLWVDDMGKGWNWIWKLQNKFFLYSQIQAPSTILKDEQW